MSDTLLLILFGNLVLFVVAALLFWLWPRTGRIGINTRTVFCPRCQTKAPLVRVPKNTRQLMWGGWTCQKCECEFDKYGNEVGT
jgi:hypothetical protein